MVELELTYNTSSNESKCRIGNWVEENALARVTGFSRHCKDGHGRSSDTMKRTLYHENTPSYAQLMARNTYHGSGSSSQTNEHRTKFRNSETICPKKAFLDNQFRILNEQATMQTGQNQGQDGAKESDTISILKNRAIIQEVMDAELKKLNMSEEKIRGAFNRNTAFTNDPRFNPEKVFAEENLTNVEFNSTYNFYLASKSLVWNDGENLQKLSQRFKRCYGFTLLRLKQKLHDYIITFPESLLSSRHEGLLNVLEDPDQVKSYLKLIKLSVVLTQLEMHVLSQAFTGNTIEEVHHRLNQLTQ